MPLINAVMSYKAMACISAVLLVVHHRSISVLLLFAGALSGLQRNWASNRKGSQWINPDAPMGRFVYSTYTEDDYNVIWNEYLYIDPSVWWIARDLGKFNASAANPVRSDTVAIAQAAWVKQVHADPPDKTPIGKLLLF